MRKILIIILFALFPSLSEAQIFTNIDYYDKFDDVLKSEVRKTLVTKTDSTFVIEEKGKEPVCYIITNEVDKSGSKDHIVNLVGDVYGYETSWCVVRKDMYEDYQKVFFECVLNNTKENVNKLSRYWMFAVHRTITMQYSGNYLRELFWISDDWDKLGKGVSRIIYSK